MYGYDVAEELRKNSVTKNIPFLFLGCQDQNHYNEYFTSGFVSTKTDIVLKPFNKEELLRKTTSLVMLSKLTRAIPEGIDIKDSKILIVDDVETNVILIKILLTNEGFQVITANNGEQCIEQARKECPDIITLDVMMPGTNGFETATILKQDPKTQNIPIMFITALNNPIDEAKGFQVGADDFLPKPFKRDELLIRIKRILIINKGISKLLNS